MSAPTTRHGAPPGSAQYPLPDRNAIVTGARTAVGQAIRRALVGAGAQVLAVDDPAVDGPDAADPSSTDPSSTDPSSTDPFSAVVDGRRPDLARLHLSVHVVEVPASPHHDPPATRAPGPTNGWDGATEHALTTAARLSRRAAALLTPGGALVFVAVPPADPGRAAVLGAGLSGLVRSLATEFGPAGVRVNQISGPGCVDQPEQVAAAVLFLGGERSAGVNAQTLSLGAPW